MRQLTASTREAQSAAGVSRCTRRRMMIIPPKEHTMRKIRFVMTLALASTAVASMALPTFVGQFQKIAKPKAGSALAAAGCKTCHSVGTKLNPYGADVKKALTKMKTKTLTPAI